MIRLPNPPVVYDRMWGNQYTRIIENEVGDLQTPISVGWMLGSYSPTRDWDAKGAQHMAVYAGSVTITTGAASAETVFVTGVGGEYSLNDATAGELYETQQVVGTLLNDMYVRSRIG